MTHADDIKRFYYNGNPNYFLMTREELFFYFAPKDEYERICKELQERRKNTFDKQKVKDIITKLTNDPTKGDWYKYYIKTKELKEELGIDK